MPSGAPEPRADVELRLPSNDANPFAAAG
jgi:hypothetical protein